MNAAETQREVAKRVGCTVNLLNGREFTGMGNGSEAGAACANCSGCDASHGVVGLAASGVDLVLSHGNLQLSWTCPGCGCTVVEQTTVLGSCKAGEAVALDGECNRCRAIR